MLKTYLQKNRIEAGCDEAGRGCLAGPVFAAAVILPKNLKIKALNDSKKLTKAQRDELRVLIEKKAISYAVETVSPVVIDQINILNASFKAMHKAISKLSKRPDHLLIDGNRFNPYKKIDHTCIIKGDGKYASIAAASILAKTYRDEYMEKLHAKFPHYSWLTNKGYPTLAHRNAIFEHGKCKHHRLTFNVNRQLVMFD